MATKDSQRRMLRRGESSSLSRASKARKDITPKQESSNHQETLNSERPHPLCSLAQTTWNSQLQLSSQGILL